jgi:hypothetical protein
VAAIFLLLAGCGTAVDGRGRVAPPCPAVFFGVPGSGEGLANPLPGARPPGVTAAAARAYGRTVALLEGKLAHVAGTRLTHAAAIDYPAIPVTRYIGAGGLTADLETSERAGVRALLSELRRVMTGGCARRPILLAGYSQGAEVVVRAVGALDPGERLDVSVALLGNPSYEPQAVGDFPGNTSAAGIRPTFEHTAFRLPPDVRTRTIDVCAPGDPVCGVDPTLHTTFGRLAWVLTHVAVHVRAYAFGSIDYTGRAARFLWRHRLR